MNVWFFVETLLLVLLFFASLLVVWRTVHPDSLRRARTALALSLLAPTCPKWIKRLGRWIAPRPRLGDAAQGKACGGCKGDGSKGGCG